MQKKARKEVSKVDYRLLYKKEITDYLESLNKKEHTVWQMDESMKKLFSIGEQVVPVCLAKLRENDEELAPVICYALEFANDFSIVEPLMDILIMPTVSDKIKARILAVLSHYGVDARELPLELIIKDFDKMASDSVDEMLEDVYKDYFLLLYVLGDLEDFPLDMKLTYIRDIGEQMNEKAVDMLEIIATVDDMPVAQEAVKALGKIKSGKALYALQKLSNCVSNEALKKIIQREAQRLKFRGIAPIPYPPPVSLKKPVKIILSSIDGMGSRALWIAWKNPQKARKLTTMNLLLNTQEGIKDCWGMPHISAREFNTSIKDLEKTAIITECDLDYALTLIKDALYHNQMSGTEIPYQFYCWKHLLEQDYNLVPEPYKPAFDRYDIDFLKNDEETFRKCFELYNYSLFDDWFIAEPRVYDYAEENKSKKGYVLKKMTSSKAEKLFSKFTHELIEPQADIIKRMLEMTASFLDQAGQTELAKMVLSAFLHMDINPLYYHPFIQRMVIESLKVALDNMKNGYDMRLNPDAFE